MKEITNFKNNVMSRIFTRVFQYMFLGLLISTVGGIITLKTPLGGYLANHTGWFFALAIIEIGLVLVFKGLLYKMPPQKAKIIFFIYALLNGITLAFILLLYTASSVIVTFFVAALLFALMSKYGYQTKKDISSWGRYLFIGLIGILVASLINLFLGSSFMEYLISVIGVVVFLGLTAYDIHRIKKQIERTNIQNPRDIDTVAINGALHLYLDFVNLFIDLLRLLGKNE